MDSDKFGFFSLRFTNSTMNRWLAKILFLISKALSGISADVYTELHDVHKNSDYVNEFQKVFSVKGAKIENVLGPAYQAISHAVEGLEKMEVSKDDNFDKDESEKIKGFCGRCTARVKQLIDLGLYDDSQIKIMRDRAANALRTIVLDLHNNLSELQKSEGLLEVAIKMAGTESLKNKLKGELERSRKMSLRMPKNLLQ